MKPIEFIQIINTEVVDVEIYKNLFNETAVESATDEYWIKALTFFKNLKNEDKEVFFSIIRQIEVDTVSCLLNLIDDEDFKLTHNKTKINGELNDIFLELEEEK